MHNRWRLIPYLLLALLLVAGVAACDEKDDDNPASTEPITVTDAWVRATIPGAETGGVTGAFMTISSHGSAPDTLVSARVEPEIAGAVEIHETTMGDNDVMQMRPVEGVEIPAGGSAALKPGSYHIMLLDVQRDLNPGDVVSLTLTFASGLSITVDADVRALE